MNICPHFRLLALTLASVATTGLLFAGCDQEPRPGEQPTDNRPTLPETPGEDDDGDNQTGAEISELERHTDEHTEQCIDIVDRVMECTSDHDFHDMLTGEDGGEPIGEWTDEHVERASFFWHEAGGQRRTCEQMFSMDPSEAEAFHDAQTLERLAAQSESACEEFARLLVETGALEALSETDI